MTIDFTKPVVTRSGKAVKILTTEALGDFPVFGNIYDATCTLSFMADGNYFDEGYEHENDLMNVPEVVVRYANLYSSGHTSIYKTRYDADANVIHPKDRLSCVRIEIKEGVFDA
jgi:hypothetical protein